MNVTVTFSSASAGTAGDDRYFFVGYFAFAFFTNSLV